MSEKELVDFFKQVIRKEIVEDLSEYSNQGPEKGLRNFCKDFIEKLNIKPLFINKDQDIEESRKKMNKEPGLIISNHPSSLDGEILLSVIERPDLKIVVNEKLYKELSKTSFVEKFIPALFSREGAFQTVKEIIDHIKKGGAVLIFPNAGFVDEDGKEVPFFSGFRFVVSKLSKDDMVYCFNINLPEDLKEYSKNVLGSHTGIDFVSGFSNPLSPLKEQREVLVKEKYTNVSDWQRITNQNNNNSGQNLAMTDYYNGLFD